MTFEKIVNEIEALTTMPEHTGIFLFNKGKVGVLSNMSDNDTLDVAYSMLKSLEYPLSEAIAILAQMEILDNNVKTASTC